MKKIKNLLVITVLSVLAFSCNKKGDCVCHVPGGDAYQIAEDYMIPYAENSTTIVYEDREKESCDNLAKSENDFQYCKLRK